MSEVPGHHAVLRLPRPPPDFAPAYYRPTARDVRPSDGDKHDAKERGVPVRVSVWDEERTSARQAADFRSVRPLLVLRALGSEVASVGETIRIVYDPLGGADASRPGAEGHAGIEGLDRPDGHPRAAWNKFLDDVAGAFELVEVIED
ncbi:MAG: hypothetical protein M5U28_23230 [Sandaracinaceae bacterium]|nr:hypothetical protein [Sandaracinaceae bacterium]